MINAIVLAAGKGTRMKSEHSKVMHKILGEPMIGHVYDNLKAAGVSNIVMVVGHKNEEIKEYLKDKVDYALQSPQLGSGHAVMMAEALKNNKGKTLIVNGDCPLIQKETYENLIAASQDYDLTVLTTKMEDPGSYGRIVRDEKGDFLCITEFKDCNEIEKKINEINVGIYCVDNELLWKYLPMISNDNAQKEYYITDLVKIFNDEGKKVNAYISNDPDEMIGVNDRKMLSEATTWLKNKVNYNLMVNGVTLIDPSNTYISKDVVIGNDSIIYPNVVMEGKVVIGKETIITSNSFLRDVVIGDNCVIDASEITDSEIGNKTTIGPFAHLRNGCKIADEVRIGNFVELKNTSFGFNTKCAHLTYVGDAKVGAKVNFGCGVVTVNYDGKNKYETVIEDEAFIGSNVNIIAPCHIGKKALLAAGSTITDDVKEGDMGIARSKQSIKEGYGKKYLNK